MKKQKAQKVRKAKKSRIKLILVIIVGIIIAIGLIGYLFISNTYSGQSKWLYIPQNATAESIKDSLTTHFGEHGNRIYTMWDLADGNAKKSHGAYLIDTGEKELDIARRLKRGQQTPIKVTFNNCRTLQQLAEKISMSMEMNVNDFLEACDSVLPKAGFSRYEQYPAAFLPDTYEFYWSSEPQRVVKRLLDYRNKFWNDERRAKAKAHGLNPVKVMTVASIVEEETNKNDERPMVARLYLNRLNMNMPLQADPTIKFALGDFSLRRITQKHLQVESPYNTYKHNGLPPGPIRIVDKSTIDAVLDAPEHKYLYMCAKEDFSGYHNFATDYSTHKKNAKRYQAELNKRKIYK